MTDSKIEALGLRGHAYAGAYALKAKHPTVAFTSGRRDIHGQAHAMATNVVLNRQWIWQTYSHSQVSFGCHQWVLSHPEAKTVDAITEGLESVLLLFSPAELARQFRHIDGDAFDVKPIFDVRGPQIIATIEALPGLDKFLPKEGGLIRWHAQFHPSITIENPTV